MQETPEGLDEQLRAEGLYKGFYMAQWKLVPRGWVFTKIDRIPEESW